jgi:hypothetical protein
MSWYDPNRFSGFQSIVEETAEAVQDSWTHYTALKRGVFETNKPLFVFKDASILPG